MYQIFEQILQERGITPYRVSKETGISQTALSNWKKGKCVPSTQTLKKVADYLSVTLDYLMSGEDVRSIEQIEEDNNEDPYYINDDAREMAQFLFENPDYKVLFDASRHVKKEDIEFVKQMLDRFRGDDNNGL